MAFLLVLYKVFLILPCHDAFAAARQGLSDLLPFHNDIIENSKHYKSKQNEESYSFQESVLGVPTHFQNDGSALYMLTHAFLPPTSDSIDQWLREEAEKACSDDVCGKSSFLCSHYLVVVSTLVVSCLKLCFIRCV